MFYLCKSARVRGWSLSSLCVKAFLCSEGKGGKGEGDNRERGEGVRVVRCGLYP